MNTNDTNGDKIYFDSYSQLEVHAKMLNDTVRNEAYRNAILSNRKLFENKIILDVGAGTGILSIYCAQAGAAKVYAVEASNIVTIARNIIRDNNFENIIRIIHDKIENVDLPEMVDVIVSEWMGFYLFHESMLDSVLWAKNKFLRSDGILFPDRCKLYAAPCALPSFHSQWNIVDGVKMNSFGVAFRKLYADKPKIMKIHPSHLLTDGGSCIYEFDLTNITVEKLDEIRCTLHSVCQMEGTIEGICIWFETLFPEGVILSTAPDRTSTHWKQTVLVLQQGIDVDDASPFFGRLVFRKNATVNRRRYDIEFEFIDPEKEEHTVPCACNFVKCRIINELSKRYDERDETLNDVD